MAGDSAKDSEVEQDAPDAGYLTRALELARQWQQLEEPEPAPVLVAENTVNNLKGIESRLTALLREQDARAEKQTLDKADAWLSQQRARSKLALDFAGWESHGDAAVWSLGYYVEKEFRVIHGLPKSMLSSHWFPLLHRQHITPYVIRDYVRDWIAVMPGAY